MGHMPVCVRVCVCVCVCLHRVVQDLLQRFLEVEEKFRLGGSDGPGTEQEAIDTMRKV